MDILKSHKKSFTQLFFVFCLTVICSLAFSGVALGEGGGDSGGGDGAGCFLPGSLVKMHDGTMKAIEKVEVGDQVVGYDIGEKEFTVNTVLELEAPMVDEWFKIILENGSILRTTADHPIYIEEYNSWASIDPEAARKKSGYKLNVQQLEVGQHVLNYNAQSSRIIDIVRVPERVQTYNLKNVSVNNTFFVENFLVHNKVGGGQEIGDTVGDVPCGNPADDGGDSDGDPGDSDGGSVCADSCGAWSSWSACSAACGGGTQSRSRTCTSVTGQECSFWERAGQCLSWVDTCSSSVETQTQACNVQACCNVLSWAPATNTVCSGTAFVQTSNCGTARQAVGTKCCVTSWAPKTNTVCSGTAFVQTSNCGTNRQAVGTKCCVTSWLPAANTVCSGTAFVQTSNCGTAKPGVGSKTCQASYCNVAGAPLLYCNSEDDVYGVYSFWNNTGCSAGACQGFWSFNSCGDTLVDDCGSDTCDTSGAEYEYCNANNIWVKNDGTSQGCAAAACFNDHQFCNHHEKEVCEVGFTCQMVGADDAECVAKAGTWTEI